MDNKPFSFIHDLSPLDETARQKYLGDLSEHLGLPRDLNALDTIWMNDNGGLRKLVAYARRGTTDILRNKHQIEVKSLVQGLAEGAILFIATGVDKTGRQEIAVGSHHLTGLVGDRLAYAIMTAQTRALRRLTLQFVGAGLLGDAEVNGLVDVSNAASLASLAGTATVLPPPQVVPAPAPGKDITVVKAEYHVPLPPHVGDTVVGIPQTETPCGVCKTPLSGHKFVSGQGMVCPDKQADISSAKTSAVEVVPPTATPAVATVAAQTTSANEPAKEADKKADTEAPKRTRRRKNTVDISSPGQVSANAEKAQNTETAVPAPPTAPVSAAPPALPSINCVDCGVPLNRHKMEGQAIICPKNDAPPAATPVTTTTNAPTPVTNTIPTDAFKEFRKRLDVYAQKVLPEGGMLPTEGIGGVTMKLRRFAVLHTGASSNQAMTEEQFTDLFEFMDGYSAQHGSKGLVVYIDKAIGATK